MSTAEDLADSIRKLVSREQPIGLDHLALTVDPLRLYRVEPRALLGEKAGHYTHTPLPRSLSRARQDYGSEYERLAEEPDSEREAEQEPSKT